MHPFKVEFHKCVDGYNLPMLQKGDRSKRRGPRKGFPHRVAGYLDEATLDMVSRAAEAAGESISTFVARSVKDRAEAILRPKKQTDNAPPAESILDN
jgi:hypothetical protein